MRIETVTAVGCLHEAGHEVVARVGDAFGDEGLDVLGERVGRRFDILEVSTELEGERVRELVAPAGEQIVIGPRDAEHFADDLHRIVIGELRHELARSAGRERVDEPVHDGAHRVPVPRRRPGRERSADQAT